MSPRALILPVIGFAFSAQLINAMEDHSQHQSTSPKHAEHTNTTKARHLGRASRTRLSIA